MCIRDREVVSRFLSETYAILSRQENFFRRMKVYFIQCDCLIQDVALIRNREDWLAYEKKIRIRGRGGTDFTPVFDYVEKQRQLPLVLNYRVDGMSKDGSYLSLELEPWECDLLLEQTKNHYKNKEKRNTK